MRENGGRPRLSLALGRMLEGVLEDVVAKEEARSSVRERLALCLSRWLMDPERWAARWTIDPCRPWPIAGR